MKTLPTTFVTVALFACGPETVDPLSETVDETVELSPVEVGPVEVETAAPIAEQETEVVRCRVVDAPGPALAIPLVYAISPDSIHMLSEDTVLDIEGDGFAASSVVLLDGSPLETTYVSTRLVQALLPKMRMRCPHTAQITVNTPPSQESSEAIPFAIIAR